MATRDNPARVNPKDYKRINIFVVGAKKNPAKTRGGASKDVRGIGAR